MHKSSDTEFTKSYYFSQTTTTQTFWLVYNGWYKSTEYYTVK